MVDTASAAAAGPLAGLRVLDLSRVLAGPWASQILGDLGAEVFKIEQPGNGDDTRKWGPPFLDNADGSRDAAYYQCCNRNKHALAIDLAQPAGADLVRALAARCDVVIENFRFGGLAKYGLDYATIARENPAVVYASITGFGQTGPYRDRGGYDFLIQGMSGLMSVTGIADGNPGAGPIKVGVPISDLATGLYSAVSVLAALRHRDRTGEGQHIDCALFDTQVSLLANQASNFLNGGAEPQRLGNQHPNVVPYQDFAVADGRILIALGNDRQYRDFCRLLGAHDLADDPRLQSNAGRNAHRAELIERLEARIAAWPAADLLAAMDAARLPGGRINDIPTMFDDPQVLARELVREFSRDDGTKTRVVGYPHKFSATPPSYRKAPPRIGEDTNRVLRTELGLDHDTLAALHRAGVIVSAE
jgi:crotonobetainyl-CoA:carnitine CoA-transferase CaiB-like acyl-CoA transferase